MQASILLIGSLLWDENNDRQEWRASHLAVAREQHVPAAIRYGRRSSTRNCTFTMTFDSGDPSGKAVVIPCAKPVQNIEDLVAEAEALWKAERPKAVLGELGTSWGCVGALFRDSSHELVDRWCNAFRRSKAPILSPVDDRGLLQMRWPLEESADIHVLLATANLSDCKRPSPREIAEAWIERGGEEYFFRSIEHGIRTGDDAEIWGFITQAAPGWLQDPRYKKAIGILEGLSRSA